MRVFKPRDKTGAAYAEFYVRKGGFPKFVKVHAWHQQIPTWPSPADASRPRVPNLRIRLFAQDSLFVDRI